MLFTQEFSAKRTINPTLQSFLFGKELPLEELPFPPEIINSHIRAGWISLRPGIEARDEGLITALTGRKSWICRRCGNTRENGFGTCTCAHCGKACVYCRHCLPMGVIRSCTRLASWSGPEPEQPHSYLESGKPLCVWNGRLSPEQEQAAIRLDQALNAGDSFLVWAVTGAGKTELLFPAIGHALRRGESVTIAAPRIDVVRELYPRIRAAFPDVPVSALYGGSEHLVPGAPLVLATAHQLIRYYHCFDKIFIDEVDAFPFHFDPMLDFAVRKAGKPGAPIGYLSATPPHDLKYAYESGRLAGTKIARRYHGHPLPVPRCQWAGNWAHAVRKSRLPRSFFAWLQKKSEEQKQLFCFVPSVALCLKLTGLIQKAGLSPSAGVHAQDPDRHEKVTAFREGRLRILVTTTILERGVTVPGVDIAVFGADDPVFDERALVQISGRAGRAADQPDGEIVFFHNGRTLEMIRAVRHIEKMNREGGF
ncbi:DEAD/DEAH box helicase [Sporolactobacillus vineae]|uniref:DEAD/DEAH box helicase n=1 Tax=Sporolactobacillus vineae TaxID=444463 RepID=UPI0002891E66|nr:helicase-related protein [Sporolactobacillus vineae]